LRIISKVRGSERAGASDCQVAYQSDIEHLPLEQSVASILEKEQRIAAIVGEIQTLLARGES